MFEATNRRASVGKGEDGRPNTIGMRERDLSELLNILDNDGGGQDRRRAFARWPFRSLGVSVEVFHPGGQSVELRMACRNLSGGGIGLLHNAYVHIGSSCRVTLPGGPSGLTEVRGEVARCQHVQGTVHEVGIRFDEPIAVRDFIRKDAARGWFAVETVDETELTGTVLHIDPNISARQRLRGHLNGTRLAVRSADTGAAGLERAGVDGRGEPTLIICATRLPDMSGIGFCVEAARRGLRVPIVLTAQPRDEEAKRAASEARAAGFLIEPLDRDLLLRAIAEFAIAPSGAEGAAAERVGGAEVLMASVTGGAVGESEDIFEAAETARRPSRPRFGGSDSFARNAWGLAETIDVGFIEPEGILTVILNR